MRRKKGLRALSLMNIVWERVNGLVSALTVVGLPLVASCGLTVNPGEIRLNEVMASNETIVADSDGDYQDWIELYNYGEKPVDVTGFYLSDDPDKLRKWRFPNLLLQAGEHRLIWASGKDRVGDELHTNFSIARDGEEIFLVSPDGEMVDRLVVRKMPPDVSTGRYGHGKSDWYYYDEPTPSKENAPDFYLGITEPPEFSVSGGFYEMEPELTLSADSPEDTILYTLDGSAPDDSDLDGSVYQYKKSYPRFSDDEVGELLDREYRTYRYDTSNPIRISDELIAQRPFQYEINTTWNSSTAEPLVPPFRGVAIRARAHRKGYLPSEIVTHTYFSHWKGCGRYSVPVFSLVTDEQNLFEYKRGIYVPGTTFDRWRKANPSDEADGNSDANFRKRGRAWEREANVELFNGCEGNVINQRAGVRIHGGWTRSYFKKSLRFYARKEYGDRWFDYPFFGSASDGKFRRFILRQSGNDMGRTLFRDALMHRLVGKLDLETQHYSPIVLFINGEYWGVHNLRERVDHHYLARRHGVDPDNLDLLSIDGSVEEGSNDHYRETMRFVAETDLSDPGAYRYLGTLMDIDNYIDYHSSQVFFTNRDWPGNNIAYWRVRTNEYVPGAKKGHDGRWRWILYDTDFTFYDPEVNMLDHVAYTGTSDSDPWWTRLFRNLLDNEEFRYSYINRLSDHLNTIFQPDVIISHIDEMEQRLDPLMSEHISRWRTQESLDVGNSPIPSVYAWRQNVERMREFALDRSTYLRQHMMEFFELDGVFNITLSVNGGMGKIRLNSLVLDNPDAWQGLYFGGVPISVEAIPEAGFVFDAWEGDVLSGTVDVNNPTLELDLTSNLLLNARFKRARD